MKCSPEDYRDGGGYVIRFLSDQQSCYTLSLYIGPGGYHCVLYIPIDVHYFDCGDKDEYGRERSSPVEGHPKDEPSGESRGFVISSTLILLSLTLTSKTV